MCIRDRLKPLQTNDRVGDCAALVRKQLEPPDFVGHLGNGIFVLVMPETAAAEAQAMVGKLVGLLADDRVAYRSRLVDVKDVEGGAERLLERLLA